MIIKKFIVTDMNEAMNKIRKELGNSAVIISERKIKTGGFMGLFCKRRVEVTAAIENRINKSSSEDDNIKKFKKAIENKNIIVNKENLKQENKENEKTQDIMKEIENIKKLIGNINSGSIGESEDKKTKRMLLNNDIEEYICDNIMQKMKTLEGKQEFLENLKDVINSLVSVSTTNLGKITVLVGPTGVGKTTTIAKLAGRIALVEKKKVGVITIDTYRIGAVEQLKTYADIMNIPFKVIFSAKEIQNAIDEMKHCDVILIDTTGRSSKNLMQISELRAFIEKVETNNIHLVLSATTKNKDLDSIIKGYEPLNYNNVIITKLDETTTYGSILNICNKSQKPISFLTIGQSVPEDIKMGDKEFITKLILGEEKLC